MTTNGGHESKPKPPLRDSRKFRTYAYFILAPVGFATALAEIAVFVAMLRDRIGLEAGAALMIGSILPLAYAAAKGGAATIDGWTREDVAETEAAAPPKPLATAEVRTTNVIPTLPVEGGSK